MKKKQMIIILGIVVVLVCGFGIKYFFMNDSVDEWYYSEGKVSINNEIYDFNYDYGETIKEDHMIYSIPKNTKEIVIVIPEGACVTTWMPQKEVEGLELVENSKQVIEDYPTDLIGGSNQLQKFVYKIKDSHYKNIILKKVNIREFENNKNVTFEDVNESFQLIIQLQ